MQLPQYMPPAPAARMQMFTAIRSAVVDKSRARPARRARVAGPHATSGPPDCSTADAACRSGRGDAITGGDRF
jgi:hypothetical protein